MSSRINTRLTAITRSDRFFSISFIGFRIYSIHTVKKAASSSETAFSLPGRVNNESVRYDLILFAHELIEQCGKSSSYKRANDEYP